MEVTGLGLAVLAEVRSMAESMKDRWKMYKAGPEKFAVVDEILTRLLGVVDEIDTITSANPDAIPKEVVHIFRQTVEDVKCDVGRSCNIVDGYCSKAFGGDSRGGNFKRATRVCRRLFKAKSLAAVMTDIEQETSKADNKLQHLLNRLHNDLKADEVKKKVGEVNENVGEVNENVFEVSQKVDDVQVALGQVKIMQQQSVPSEEEFSPAFNAPVLPGNIRLDFHSKDMDGRFSAPEGKLKALIFVSISSALHNVTVARGAAIPMHAVSGMAGVGKTTALIGLGHDVELSQHFSDGILYSSLGAEATEEKVIGELTEIMQATGAKRSAMEVKSTSSLSDAVTKAALWFQSRRILFLIDDVWPSVGRPDGYFTELQSILRGSPESRIAITTRSRAIATTLGSFVDFGARTRLGPAAISMFMSHATPNIDDHCNYPIIRFDDDCRCQDVRGILDLCAGLPIALAVAGRAVALRVTTGLVFESACRIYLEELMEELYPGASFLETAVDLSLRALDEKMGKNESRRQPGRYSFAEMYASLCVLRNQQFAPVSVLARMWNVSAGSARDVCIELSSLSLAKMSTRSLCEGKDETGIVIHDLHLDFCRDTAEKKGGKAQWHRRLLDGHIEQEARLVPTALVASLDADELGVNIFDHTPRLWWKEHVVNQNYIRNSLSRHLKSAELYVELGATILNIRWIDAQVHTGGIIALRTDLIILQDVFAGESLTRECIRGSISSIQQVLEERSSHLRNGLRVISFILLSRLFDLSKTDVFLKRFLECVKEATPTPFLTPILCSYRPPGNFLKRAIAIGDPGIAKLKIKSVDFSPCEKYIVTATNIGVTVVKVESQARLQGLQQEHLNTAKFSCDSLKIFLASKNNSIYVWDWSTSELPSLVLSGHTKSVASGRALRSDGSTLLSGSLDSTLKVWNVETGVKTGDYCFQSPVECVAAHWKTRLVAVGTKKGRIHCLSYESGAKAIDFVASDERRVRSIEFSPDGQCLVSGVNCGAPGTYTSSNLSAWDVSNWRKMASGVVNGDVGYISFNADGRKVLLGCFHGQIYSWDVLGGSVTTVHDTRYGVIKALRLKRCEDEIMVAYANGCDGCVRIWDANLSRENLADARPRRRKDVKSFSLSADGTCVVVLTRSKFVIICDAVSGVERAKYGARQFNGRLALGSDGKTIAMGLEHGAYHSVRIWNTEQPPGEEDLRLDLRHVPSRGISFSPNGNVILALHKAGASFWDVQKCQKLGEVGAARSFHPVSSAAFSHDGKLFIIKEYHTTTIWNLDTLEKIFDFSISSSQELSLQDAKQIIRKCGPKAHRLWPLEYKTRHTGDCPFDCTCCSRELNVNNILMLAPNDEQLGSAEYCRKTLVMKVGRRLGIFRMVHRVDGEGELE